MSQAVVITILAAYAIARKVFSWSRLSSEERRAALRYMVLMGGGGGLTFTMATRVDSALTAGWPEWARVLWVIGIFGGLLLAIGGWWKLLGMEILPGENTRRFGEESFLALVPRHGRAWQHRARRGAVIVLLWGGLGAIGLFAVAVMRGDPIDGAIVSLGFLAVLAMSGAVGGLAYHITEPVRSRGRACHVAANVISLLAYCAAAIILLILGVAVAEGFGVGW